MGNYLGGLYPALVPQIDVSPISNFLAGIPEQLEANRKRNLLQNVSRIAGDQGYLPASKAAMAGGDLELGLGLQRFQDYTLEQKTKMFDIFSRAANASTDDEWNSKVLPMAQRITGEDDPFDGMDRKAIAAFGEKQKNAFQLGEIYNNSGHQQKGVFDPETGQFAPMGGSKAGSGGISFTTPDGSTLEIGGDQGNAALSKTTQSQVQQKAINTSEMGARVASIAADFKPEYLTLGTRLQNVWRSGKAKIDPSSLGEGERKSLGDYASFRSKSIGNVNRLLNELSGAAVSPQEAERLKAEVPNPGTGLFDGDDPVTFQAKMERIMSDSNAALARYRFYQATGIPNNIEDIPLSNVKRGPDGVWRVMKDGKVYRIGEVAEERPQ